MKRKRQIKIKSQEELDTLRQAGKILSVIIKDVTCSLKSGMTTAQIDAHAEQLIKAHDVKPAFKGYRGFPACSCISINQQVVHGIPGERIVREGDIVSIDIGIVYKDYFSDTAVTVGIGPIEPQLQKLIDVSQTALAEGIEQARENRHLSDISHAIQSYVEAHDFSVVRDFVGHGIGQALHEDPEVPNFGPPHCGPVLRAGMVFAIEPMVNCGTWKTRIAEDGWTVETLDGKPSAHFEHTVAVTEKGPEILTLFSA
jgi:methionyl aminopeptidase